MFDLNTAIENWKNQFSEKGALKKENIEELESHVLDEMDTLQHKGLSAEESFIVAAKRMGSEQTLTEEFGKVNVQAVWTHRLAWIFLGSIIWGMINSLGNLLYNTTFLSLSFTSLADVWIVSLSIFVYVAYAALIVFMARKMIEGSRLTRRLSSLKRWGIFAVLFLCPKCIGLLNSLIPPYMIKAVNNNPEYPFAYAISLSIHTVIRLLIGLGVVYFTARYFSKNRDQTLA